MSLFRPPNVDNLFAKRDVNKLIKALRYKDASVRIDAADALGEIGDSRAVEPLCKALTWGSYDDDDDVRFHVAIALGKIGDPRATDTLDKYLYQGPPGRAVSATIWAGRRIEGDTSMPLTLENRFRR